MAARRVSRGCVALTVVLTGCAGDDTDAESTTTTVPTTTVESTTTTAPERPASTTTTAFDPASVEGAVEAAYLRSWDVYADAVFNLELDEAALAEVYADESLEGKTAEIEDRMATGRAAYVDIEHDYEIVLSGPSRAQVVDSLVNHQVLIDPVTKEPIESDPNEVLLLNFRMDQGADGWRVVFIEKVDP